MNVSAIRTISAICVILGILSIVIQTASLLMRSFVLYDVIFHGIWSGILYIITGSLGISASRTRTRSILIGTLVLSILSIGASIVAAALSGVPTLMEFYHFCSLNSKKRCHPTTLLILQWALMAASLLALLSLTTLTILVSKAVCCNKRKDMEEDSKGVPYIDIGNAIKAIENLPSPEEKPKRISEIFLKKNAKLIREGHPNIYLLNAKEILTSEDFRWFNIGRTDAATPSEDDREHKVIILMGATGCGKSTLIDAMVNYILGVKWKDSFRFKCVRDGNSNFNHQAHNKTTCVTAYTIRHQEGMAVSYSVTIIDTPGYGSTRGAKRDKEITKNIQQFLSHQKNKVDQIHAACFVAASGDNRLTATQRYTIDSIFSVFGRDVKENMHLLVTFADNAHPPVVEACLAANFPVTLPSAGMNYSKFNSSALFASNEQQDEEELSFDQRFWKMSQKNFYKFFNMLGGMNGCSRKSPPEVFQSRQLLELSLEDMKRELADCLVNIENMEMFRRQMREYGHKMDQFNDQVQISLMRSRAAEEQP